MPEEIKKNNNYLAQMRLFQINLTVATSASPRDAKGGLPMVPDPVRDWARRNDRD